jgi:chemotaxis protein methyltransferase CheR
MSVVEFKHFDISDREFKYLQQLVYREAGINLTDAKKCLVQTRVGKLMRKNNIDGYDALFAMLENDASGDILVTLLDAISTNHTFFFREDAHFKYLIDHIVPWLLTYKKHEPIRIWSAACSSGEEPYSIAISMMETLENKKHSGFEILASDLSTKVLDQAAKGIYPYEVIEQVPIDLKRKYFQRSKNSAAPFVRVKEEVRRYIRYRRHNLLYPITDEKPFDIIFCRNVMIYFDYETKTKVVNTLYNMVAPQGWFITGHSESLSMIKHPFRMIQPTIYRKL